MAVVDSHDHNWEASRCVRRSFLVCFWYDLRAAWKIRWKCEEAVAVAVAEVWDMKRAWDDGRADAVKRRIGDLMAERMMIVSAQHWARGAALSASANDPDK